MKWASAISETARLEDAIEEASDSIADQLGDARADLVLAFASPEYGDHFRQLAPRLQEAFPGSLLVGCSAGGVIGAGREVEQAEALSLTGASLPGVELTPFHLGPEADDWDRRIGIDPAPPPAFLLFPDPFSVRAELLVRWFDAAYPHSVKLGGLASGSAGPGDTALFLGDAVHRTGTVGLALSGDIQVESLVAQGCRPIGSPMFATRTEHNALLELDGRPAAEVLESLYSRLSPEDQKLLQTSLFLGLVMDPDREQYSRGDFLIRNIVGLDAQSGAILVGADLSANTVVQFHLRDAETSADDLAQLLRERQGPPPEGALLFSCLGRGHTLYGRPDHDSELFARQVGPVPLGGFFSNGEIGPVQGQTYVHGYTSSFALFRHRD